MILNKLYELAFSYKKTKLWKKLYDTQVFAVRLSDSEVGYMCVMGAAGEHCALALYVGDKGFESICRLMFINSTAYADLNESAMNQNCLQCSFENKEMFLDEELNEVRRYASAHNIKLGGKNAYPQFMKYASEYMPWSIDSKKEQEQLCEALAATIEMSRLIESKSIAKPGDFTPFTKEIPILELKNGKYTIGTLAVSPILKFSYPRPEFDDIQAAKIKRLRKSEVWECRVSRISKPLQTEQEEIPTYPVILLARSMDSDTMLPPVPVIHYNENSSELMEHFINFMLENRKCPKEIRVSDELSYSFFEELCKSTGIELIMCDEMEEMDDAEQDFMDYMEGDIEDDDIASDFNDIIDILSQISVVELKTLPSYIVSEFKELAMSGMLPKDIVDKLNKAFGFKNKK